MTRLKQFLFDTSGATAIEYGLIATGIAIAIIASVNAVGVSVTDIFVAVDNGFN